jgi:hypothetical protein
MPVVEGSSAVTDVVPESASLARLRTAWLESAHAPASAACLDAGWIWDALSGTTAPGGLDAGLAHVAECASCAEAWRLAHELMIATGQVAPARPAAPAWTSWRVWLPAAAALVLVAGGTAVDRGWIGRGAVAPEADVVRGAAATLAPTMAEPGTCSRAACRVSWTDAGAGARYTIRITTGRLEPVAYASGLREPAYVVPAAQLQKVASGSELLWQVEAALPDGQRLSSATFPLVVR